MKKCFMLIAFLCCAGSSFATDHWQSKSQFGFSNYLLTNAQQHKLILACNRNAGVQHDHSISFIMDHAEYHNTARQTALVLKIDQNLSITPPATTTWRSDADTWNQLKDALAKANKIDVFLQGQHVSQFEPSLESIQSIATEIHGCDANG